MKITEDVRKYAAEQGIAAEEAFKRGMEAKSKEFVERARRFTRTRELENGWKGSLWREDCRRSLCDLGAGL